LELTPYDLGGSCQNSCTGLVLSSAFSLVSSALSDVYGSDCLVMYMVSWWYGLIPGWWLLIAICFVGLVVDMGLSSYDVDNVTWWRRGVHGFLYLNQRYVLT